MKSDGCGAPLAAGAFCDIAIAPYASADGPFSGSLSIAGLSSAIALSGTASGFVPAISHEAGSLVVGGITTSAATGACTDLKIGNIGYAAGGAGAVLSIGGNNASMFQTCTTTDKPCSSSAIAAGSYCTFGIQLKTANTNATYSATASVTASGLSTGVRTVSGTVSGLVPVLAMNNGSLTASPIAATSPGACTAVPVSNTGTATLTQPTLSFTGTNASNFQACTPTANACTSAGILPNSSCDLGFRLATTTNGSYAATATASVAGQTSVSRPVTGSATGFDACPTPGQSCGNGEYYIGNDNGVRLYGVFFPSAKATFGNTTCSAPYRNINAGESSGNAIGMGATGVAGSYWTSTAENASQAYKFVISGTTYVRSLAPRTESHGTFCVRT